MKKSKIIKAIAAVATFATVFTTSFSSIASAYSLSMANATTINSDADYNNALKVNIDNDGNLTYSEPASASTSPISSSAATGDWGDTKYDENRDFSWDNATVYFVMTDRFVNGDESNDHSYDRGKDGSGNVVSDYATREGYFHGGDLQGLKTKVDDGYFDNLGVNAIWITAPYEQIHGAMCAKSNNGFKHYAYHGYYTLDYTEMDANMGTAEDLKDFITAAHSHGIRVIFDIVMNHAGYANAIDGQTYGYGNVTDDKLKNIYYGIEEKNLNWFYDYENEASKEGKSGLLDTTTAGKWTTNWWGPKWVRMLKERFPGYEPNGEENSGNEETYLVDGLPDFLTESTGDPGIPPLMEIKWNKESTSKLATEKSELDSFFSSYGIDKSVTGYLCKWLTDWVREYGVDGFRCDTAKHVNVTEWGKLKKAGSQALKEWRENNPDEPGADWTDDFWMTGEAWDHNVGAGKDKYFTTGGFYSMINFGFQGNEGTSGSAAIKFWKGYADAINKVDNFTQLNYISSHDTALSSADRIKSGTMLLLSPGEAQIYYGDETSRPGDGTGSKQPTRSNMNWGSLNKDVLAHWQKLGQFRANHLAVGAGTQTTIDDVTCGRTYTDKNGKTDKVVISLQTGTCKVNVKGFLDNESGVSEVRDAYTGETYSVDGDTVTVNAGANGVILLEDTGSTVKKASVSASKSAGDYYEEDGTFDVTFTVKNAISATYTVDGGKEQTVDLTDGAGTAKVQVGKDAVIGDSKTIDFTLTYKDADDKTQTIEKSFTYTKAETPVIKNLIIHFKDDSWNASTVAAWVYNSDKLNICENQVWPGDNLVKGDDGWYTIEYKTTDPFMVILSGGTGRSTPDGEDPTPIQGENWYYNGKWYTSDPTAPVKPTISSFKADKTSCKLGETITFTTKATGESDLTYSYTVNGKEVEGATDSTFEFTPDKAGTYKVAVTVKDADGVTATSNNVSVKVVEDEVVDPPVDPPVDDSFTVTLKTDPTTSTQKVGTKITLSAVTSVDGDYTYTYYVNDEEVGTGKEFVWTPDKEGTYEVYVEAKNAKNKTVESDVKTFKIVQKDSEITEEKLNGVKLTADVKSPQVAGNKITFTATPDGGSNNIQYTFLINDVEVNNTGNVYSWTPDKKGKYVIVVEASDGDITVTDQLVYTISKAQTNKFTLTMNTKGSITEGALIDITASVQNANGDVTYSYYVKDSNGKVVDKLVEVADETVELGEGLKAGTYTVVVEAVDEDGNTASQTSTVNITKKGGSSEEEGTFDGSNLLLMLALCGAASLMMKNEIKRKAN